jgi:hypothetical protein
VPPTNPRYRQPLSPVLAYHTATSTPFPGSLNEVNIYFGRRNLRKKPAGEMAELVMVRSVMIVTTYEY